jgi:cell division protein FtsB
VLIACVSPADIHVDESINTLRYAERTRSITNALRQNVVKPKSPMKALRAENKRLRAQLAQLQSRVATLEEAGSVIVADTPTSELSYASSEAASDLTSPAASTPQNHVVRDELDGLQAKIRQAQNEARQARESSRSVFQNADRWRERIETEKNRKVDCIVSPILSYELSMGVDDGDSLIDDDDDCISFLSFDDSVRGDSYRLRAQVDALTSEKAALTESMLELTEMIESKRAELASIEQTFSERRTELRNAIEREVQRRNELVRMRRAEETGDDGMKLARELGKSLGEERSRNEELETRVSELERDGEFARSANAALRQRNESLEEEIQRLRDELATQKVTWEVPRPLNKHSYTNDDNEHDDVSTLTDIHHAELESITSCAEQEKAEEPTHNESKSSQTEEPDADKSDAIDKHHNVPFDEAKVLAEASNTAILVEKTKGNITSPDKHPETVKQMSPATLGSDPVQIRSHAEHILQLAERAIDRNSNASVCSSVASQGTDLMPIFEKQVVISNIENMNPDTCCCHGGLLNSKAEHVEFYLPQLTCTCGKLSSGSKIDEGGDPCALSTILRPWQANFLATLDLATAIDLVHAHKERGAILAKAMRKWRRDKGMLSVKTRSCAVALHIWARTCKSVIKHVREQKSLGLEPQRPDFLSVSQDLASVSTMGARSTHHVV